MYTSLPLNWCECKFEDVLDYEQPTRYIVSNTDYQEQGTAVLTAGKSFILGYTDEKDGIFDASKETVIIFDDFTTVSKLVDFPFKVKSSAMKILHAKKDININFLYYLMQTIHYKSDTHKRYWISEYAKQTLNLPPLAEQERIVEKIEALFADIDAGIEKLKVAQAQIKQYRQSVLSAAFSGKLYKTTEWKTIQLKDVFKIITGKTPSKQHPEFFGGDIPFAKPGDLDKEQYINITEDSLTKEGFSQAPFLPKGTILVSCIGNLGKKAILECDGSCNQQLNAILPTEKISILYTYFYVDMIKPWMEKNASATTVTILNKNTFEKAPFILPTLSEQEQIVKEIENRFAVADELEKAITDALGKAEKLKQSILKKAFQGKLVPQNPNDEPASVLLERIKNEKLSISKK